MTTEYEYYKQRKEEALADLYETVTKVDRIIAAKAIDWAIFVTGLFFVTYYSVNSETINHIWVFAMMVAFLIAYHFVKVIFKGVSIGYLIMGIRFVSVKTKEPVTKKEFYQYIKNQLKFEVQYNHIFRYYFSFDDKTKQNTPMRRFGMILVDRKDYKRFYREYRYNNARYFELQEQLNK